MAAQIVIDAFRHYLVFYYRATQDNTGRDTGHDTVVASLRNHNPLSNGSVVDVLTVKDVASALYWTSLLLYAQMAVGRVCSGVCRGETVLLATRYRFRIVPDVRRC